MFLKYKLTSFDQYTIGYYALGVIVLSSVAFSSPGLEFSYWLNGHHSALLDFLFAGITNLGDGIILAAFILLFLFYRFYLSMAMAVNSVLQGIIVSVFKRLLFPDALRPIAYLDPALVHFVEGVKVHRMMSFPSGHTMTAFGLCVFLSLCSRNRIVTLLLLVIAVLVGLSRVYLLQHFILDVAVGAAIGTITGGVAYCAFECSTKPGWWTQRIVLKVQQTRTLPKFS